LKGVLANCDKRQVPVSTVLGWTRERAVLGSEPAEGDVITQLMDKCLEKGWIASGHAGPVTISGTVPSLKAPFTLQVATPGGAGSVTFSPTGTEGGTVSEFSSSAVTQESGSGTYELVQKPNGSYLITASIPICFTEGPVSGCNSVDLIVFLEPVAAKPTA
jgi:hypothetical protein